MTRPIGVDLFAGAGGMSLGFEQAGFDVVAAVEIDPIHAAVHKFNFPNCAVLPTTVIGLTGEKIRREAGIGQQRVDAVFGGAPCQGFSLIGHRALDDPRNSLVREFVRLVHELDADYFVFENVKGLTVGKHRAFLEEIIDAFVKIGYRVVLPWQVLNAADYGVPQFRQRLFLMGARQGRQLPTYPMPLTYAAGRIGGLFAGPTCREALDDLPDVDNFQALLDDDEVVTEDWVSASEYARQMRCLDEDAWGFGYRREWDPNVLTSSMRTDHSRVSQRRFSETKPGCVEPISRFFRLPSDGVSNTLRAGTDAARGAFTSPRPIHYAKNRCVTVREMARLHSFPDWFRFHETKWHGARQIGNAVPPRLARTVASSILTAIGITPVPPTEPMDLGDPSLLRMGMSEAARYWGVAVPIGKRDRRSGARKRKQLEIEALRLSETSNA